MPDWSRIVFLQVFVTFLSLFAVPPAAAHLLNQSYVYFNVTEDSLTGRVEINTRDLARIFDREDPSPKPWSKDEVIERASEITNYLDRRLLLKSAQGPHAISYGEIDFINKSMFDGTTFVQVEFSVPDISRTPDTIEMSFDFIFSDIDPAHRGFALIDSNSRTGQRSNESYVSLAFGPGDGFKTLQLSGEPAAEIVAGFFQRGVWRVWLGPDHMLFLGAILLAAVMVVTAGQWTPASSLGGAIMGPLIAVVVLTLGHTLGLGLTALGILKPDATLLELAIAIGIIFIALGNLYPRLHRRIWIVALVLGVCHGLTSGYFLAPLGTEPVRIASGLLGFNAGIGLGLLAIVAFLFPILYVLREAAFYRPLFLSAGSVLVIALAAFWFAERSFDILGPVKPFILSLVPGG